MRLLVPLAVVLSLLSCSSNDAESLCGRYFKPYPDMVSQRQGSGFNRGYVDAMALYSEKKYHEAIPALQRVVDRDDQNFAARLYLANAWLATGDPYKAEMHLDFLENYKARALSDQVEWYNCLCWLCEGNMAKAGQQARWIASRPHTYRKEAGELAAALAKN